ncbi:MAG: VWA domain-containing protein, partial [Planctomycetota bacterium]
VDVVLLPRRDDVGIVELRVPPRATPRAPFAVEIVLGRTAGPDRPSAEVSVELFRDAARVGAGVRSIRLGRGQTRTVRIVDRVDTEGRVRYRAVARAAFGDDARTTVARIGDRIEVLDLAGCDLPPEFEVRTLPPAEAAAFLSAAGGSAGIDAIVVGAGPLSAAAQGAVAKAVREGVGLVVLGGLGSAGGPLEAVLPLTDAPPGGRAVLLALDASGSMEPHREAVALSVDRLRALLSPEDRVAYVAFRGEVFEESRWTWARDARWEIASLPATGNTRLLPALRRGAALLEGSDAAARRLYVVSDGRWQDLADAEIGTLLRDLEAQGVHAAVILVGDGAPAEAPRLFPVAVRAEDETDLRDALFRLEREAPDRVVPGPIPTSRGSAPAWLEGALPPDGACESVARLYRRGVGERIAIRSGELPLLGAWEPGGRVVVVAPDLRRNPALARSLPALVRACARPLPRDAVRLLAHRVGPGLRVEAQGGDGGPFT